MKLKKCFKCGKYRLGEKCSKCGSELKEVGYKFIKIKDVEKSR